MKNIKPKGMSNLICAVNVGKDLIVKGTLNITCNFYTEKDNLSAHTQDVIKLSSERNFMKTT
jgi:hypothetical protein